MSENNRPGREPFERWTLKQDFCNLSWGEGVCYAGKTNIIAKSSDLADTGFWAPLTSVYSRTIGEDDPFGGTDAFLCEYIGPGDSLLSYFTSSTVPNVFDTTWVSAYVKMVGGSSITQVEIIMDTVDFFDGEKQAGISPCGATVSLEDGSVISTQGAFTTPTVVVDDIGGGFYRIQIGIESKYIHSYGVDFAGQNNAGSRVADQWIMYGPQIAFEQDAEYYATTGDSVSSISDTPCYNTRATCQAPNVYDLGELPIKFCKNQEELPRGEYHIPMVASSRITPGSINPGGADSNVSAMGKRATISVTFKDAAHSDLLVDPYRDQRGYDPKEKGTFWTKWRARNPYYMHRELVYESGYLLNGAIVDSIERTFFVTGFSGPDASGTVTISGKDVLTLAANDKAKAPFASTGTLDADITDAAGSLTLSPAGIGDEEYPASGWVRIGKEVMKFTRSSDTLTLTRAQYGTDASEHSAGDTVQLCLVYDSKSAAFILEDLLANYANVPSGFLDTTQWATEEAAFLDRLYSAIITEPEGVQKLIAEMCQQMYFTVWFDERDSLVKIRAVRSAQGESVYELSDDINLVQDSIQWTDKADELVTQVWVYHTQLNPTEKLDQGDNYGSLRVIADPASEGADRNNLSRIKVVYSRWIDDGAAALELGNAIIARYGSAPRECTFKLDAKDRDVWLADFVRLTNRLRTDFNGDPVPVNMQVYEAQETTAGTTFTYKAKEYISALTDGDVVVDPTVKALEIDSDRLNVNMREYYDSNYSQAPQSGDTITMTIRQGVTVGGYAADPNKNIRYDQRDTANDFYDGGTGSVSGLSAGQIPILQRRGIVSQRTTASGAAYPDGGGNADFIIEEYPISTAFDTGTWPAGVTLNLVIEAGGRILGEGGNGSTHGLSGTEGTIFDQRFRSAAPGGDGGHALNIQHDISITNGGIIRCGSGGGGVIMATDDGSSDSLCVPGGGGAGFELSDTSSVKQVGFSGITQEPSSGGDIYAGSGGRIGSLYFGGNGGGVEFGSGFDPDGHPGLYNAGFGLNIESGQGGIAGDAINSGANLVTWVNKGDVRGAENI